MPATLADLTRAMSRPAPPEPEIPGFMVLPLAAHDLGRCSCEGDAHCLADLWSEGCVTTEEAREMMGGAA